MGTYAPFNIREQENALNTDNDYIALKNSSRIKELEKEYFEIYHHFIDNPNEILAESDWQKISILSDEKRLWYIVGAYMAKTIDKKLGREKLTNLLYEAPKNFIETYLSLKD